MSTPSILQAVLVIKRLLSSADKKRCWIMVFFALLSSTLELMTASFIILFAKVLVDPLFVQPYWQKIGLTQDIAPNQVIVSMALCMGLLYIGKNVLAAFEVFYQHFSIQKINVHFKKRLLEHYAHMDYALYLTRNASFGMQVVDADTERVFSVGLTAIAMICSETIIFICLLGMMIVMNPSLTVGIVSLGLCLTWCIRKILPIFYGWGQRMQNVALYASQHLLQFFHGFKEILLCQKSAFFRDFFLRYATEKADINALQGAVQALPRLVIEMIFIIIFMIVVVLLCWGQETPMQLLGILGGYLYAGFRLMPGLNRIINQLNNFKSIIPSVQRIDEEFSQHFSSSPRHIEPGVLSTQPFFQQKIAIKNVSFHYNQSSQAVLNNISFHIARGECIGIVGETGSGKSTLIDILLGLLSPVRGEIVVDDRVLSLSDPAWQACIGYVPQALYLIDDSIAANIAFGQTQEERDAKRLEDVVAKAQLRAFIQNLPLGLNTIVGERGVRLSGGERQRIAIARALYRDPEVLIFDEATSALDQDTEARLMDTIYQVGKQKTVIMVAHRLSTLSHCTRIIQIKEGRIVFVGSYEHLLKNKEMAE